MKRENIFFLLFLCFISLKATENKRKKILLIQTADSSNIFVLAIAFLSLLLEKKKEKEKKR